VDNENTVTEREAIRILYMEDDPGLARLFQKKLARAGYIVDVAHDGDEGLAMCETGSYDIVAVDQTMPASDGLEVIRILASRGPLPPTIMVTGTGDEVIAVEAMKLGARDYIVKDVEQRYLELLPSIIERVLRQQRFIEEKRRAEEALAHERDLLHILMDNVPDHIFFKDRESRIIRTNRAHARFLGLDDPQEAVGKLGFDFLPAEDAQRSYEEEQEIMESGRPVLARERQIAIGDGETRWLLESKIPISKGTGQTTGLVGITRDITEWKRLEEQIKRQERLAALGRLAGGIAHDFNNILTGITLSAQMTLADRRLPRDLASELKNILGDVRRAAHLVEQILDFSRRAFFETRPVNLLDFTQKTADMLRRTLPRSVHILLEVGRDDYVVEADPGRLRQVLVNLATNARDAMDAGSMSADAGSMSAPEGGELRIGLSGVRVDPDGKSPVEDMPAGDWVCLTVSDTGVGMSPEVVSHMFEPFFTTKPVGQGTGLGLAQVHGIVKQHEGYIDVDTQEGQGTTIRIYLPAQSVQEIEPARRDGGALSGEAEVPKTILLVEDEERVRELAQKALESLGYRVLKATDGQEALEVYRSAGRIDLVLTDMAMPGMGGRELMRALRKMNPALKGVAVTGYALEEDLLELMEEGITDVIHKPFDVSTLEEVIRCALESS
jgi:two-component system cell cycle sensor histidine kinase/response regulator CckA